MMKKFSYRPTDTVYECDRQTDGNITIAYTAHACNTSSVLPSPTLSDLTWLSDFGPYSIQRMSINHPSCVCCLKHTWLKTEIDVVYSCHGEWQPSIDCSSFSQCCLHGPGLSLAGSYDLIGHYCSSLYRRMVCKDMSFTVCRSRCQRNQRSLATDISDTGCQNGTKFGTLIDLGPCCTLVPRLVNFSPRCPPEAPKFVSG